MEITDLMAEQNTPPSLDGNDTLHVQYSRIDEVIKKLKDHYKITSSTNKLIATHWLVYTQVKDVAFREACLEWNKSSTIKDWKTFKTLFSDADEDCRGREKAAEKVASSRAAGRANINQVKEQDAGAGAGGGAVAWSGGGISNDRLALVLGEAFQRVQSRSGGAHQHCAGQAGRRSQVDVGW